MNLPADIAQEKLLWEYHARLNGGWDLVKVWYSIMNDNPDDPDRVFIEYAEDELGNEVQLTLEEEKAIAQRIIETARRKRLASLIKDLDRYEA